MAEQIFISYRREGGDVAAKLICEALKNRGYTVFFDYDALKGGHFDVRLVKAIKACTDMVLVLPLNALDRCDNPADWVRQELVVALESGKNIVPVMMPGFEFPVSLPEDIEEIRRFNGVRFLMEYFDAVIDKIAERLTARPAARETPVLNDPVFTGGTLTVKRSTQFYASLRRITVTVDGVDVGAIRKGEELSFPITPGAHCVSFAMDWFRREIRVDITPSHPVSILEVYFGQRLSGEVDIRVLR